MWFQQFVPYHVEPNDEISEFTARARECFVRSKLLRHENHTNFDKCFRMTVLSFSVFSVSDKVIPENTYLAWIVKGASYGITALGLFGLSLFYHRENAATDYIHLLSLMHQESDREGFDGTIPNNIQMRLDTLNREYIRVMTTEDEATIANVEPISARINF